MNKLAKRAFWSVILTLPALFLLVASSNQFRDYSPISITPGYWYAAMLVTGVCVYLLSEGSMGGLGMLAAVVLFETFAYMMAYFVAIWILSGYQVASLSLNFLYRPAMVYMLTGGLLGLAGYLFSAMTAVYAGYDQ